MAAIKTSAFSFPVTGSTFKVRTYINANVLSDNATSLDHFSIGPAYTDYLTLNSVKSSTYSSESKELLLNIGVKATPPVEPENAAVFTYYIDDVFNNDAIDSDYDVFLITNAVSASPSSSIPAVTGGTFAKTIYSLGDVNRDGSISSMDALFVLMYVEHGGASEDGRTSEQEICDRTAFLLAADYNQDGVVDRTDAEAIMRYVGNSSK